MTEVQHRLRLRKMAQATEFRFHEALGYHRGLRALYKTGGPDEG